MNLIPEARSGKTFDYFCTWSAQTRWGLPKEVNLGPQEMRDRLTEDLETCKSLCSLIPGMQLTLDPSHFIYKYHESNRPNIETIMDKVCHVRLRDTKEKKFQVCVGQGEIEFGQIIARLLQHGYHGGLSVDIIPEKDLDVAQEMRKMRLLMESLL